MKKMKKTILTLLVVASATSFALSQTVEDGIKFIYYWRYKSARETLQKVVAANPKDARAIYWLGQAYLGSDSLAGAKALYQKALNDGINDPWIWVGMGHVEILENNDVNSAKQKFEQAITATKGKGKKGTDNPDILNAIGRAMADGSSQQGDPQYGIDKLKEAAQLNITNPDIDINLGICYLKQGSDKGGVAVEAFTDATKRNPQYAEAYFHIGRIYESQNNTEFMNQWFGKAIAADPAYAPVYLEYFIYYQDKDVNAAKEYLDKYVANADQDCQTDYFVADYLYRAGKFQESLDKAKSMENGTCKDYIRVNVLYAYDYNKLGDSTSAWNAIQKYFASNPTKVSPADYVIAGTVAGKVGQTDSAVVYYQRAYDLDTVQKNKSVYIDSISNMYKRAKKYPERLEWVKKSYALQKEPTNRDMYDLGEAAYFAGDYKLSDSIFTLYEQKFPDQIYGYLWRFKVAQAADTSMQSGMIVQPSMDYLNFLKKDSTKYKGQLVQVNGTLAGYYANVKKDKDSAIYYLQQILVYDPTNPDAQKYIDALKKASEKQPADNKSSGTKSKSKPGTRK